VSVCVLQARAPSIKGALALYWRAMARPRSESENRAHDVDRRDVRLARQGKDDAFARLVERHQATVAQQMWRFTRDAVRHEELVQDVFVNAYTSLSTYRGDGPFLHWLRKIAVRAGYALWRRERKRRAERSLDPEVAARLTQDPSTAPASEAAEVVHNVLRKLPPRDRIVIVLIHLEERSVAEAADLLGWSRSMVKVQAWRARGKLKKLLSNAET